MIAASRLTRCAAALAALALVGTSACDVADAQGAGKVYYASNDFKVVPLGGADFEVVPRGGSSGPRYFCAAGDYARVRLNAPPAARVVVTKPEGRSAALGVSRSVGFTVVPQGGVSGGSAFTASVRKAGNNYSVAHARTMCPSGQPDFRS